jgi:ubiquinone/menaquinone biosynthesis C-methylase UbiE
MQIDYYSNNENTWDTIAKSFDSTRRKPWKQCINFIETLSKEDIVADIGCGNGRHIFPCSIQCKKVIGIDISRELLYIVQKKLKVKKIQNISLLHSDSRNIPIKNNSLDAILYIASLHNISGRLNRIKSLREIKRILKSNGRALISVWSRWQDKFRKQFLNKWIIHERSSEFGDINIYWRQHGFNIPRFYHLYSKREFYIDLNKAGLEIIEIKGEKLNSKKYSDNYFALVTR